jgi:TolB-like protein
MAVLPLENLSHDPAQDYFADGMTDELITTLAKISALRLISRTSVTQYKETKKSIAQIARELNVDAVLEGTVMREQDRVRITVQLIRSMPERHLWGRATRRLWSGF